ncbi:hypothetical protein EDB87DRAFT_1577540 [Lactarius vividus]|nr:hypothetical protein EDB87DRAFT_1577540 [Lactarius vividus]
MPGQGPGRFSLPNDEMRRDHPWLARVSGKDNHTSKKGDKFPGGRRYEAKAPTNSSAWQHCSDDDEVITTIGNTGLWGYTGPGRYGAGVCQGPTLTSQTEPMRKAGSNYARSITCWAFRGPPRLSVLAEWFLHENFLRKQDAPKSNNRDAGEKLTGPLAPLDICRAIKSRAPTRKTGSMDHVHFSQTKQPTPVPNLGNWCRGPGQQPTAIHWTTDRRTDRQTPRTTPSFAQARRVQRGFDCTPFSDFEIQMLPRGKEAEKESLIEGVQIVGRGSGAPPLIVERLDRVGAGRATLRLCRARRPRPRPFASPAYLGDRPLDERRPFHKQEKHQDRQEPVGQMSLTLQGDRNLGEVVSRRERQGQVYGAPHHKRHGLRLPWSVSQFKTSGGMAGSVSRHSPIQSFLEAFAPPFNLTQWRSRGASTSVNVNFFCHITRVHIATSCGVGVHGGASNGINIGLGLGVLQTETIVTGLAPSFGL